MQPVLFQIAPLEGIAFSPVAAEKCVEGQPSMRYQILHQSTDGAFTCGIYECTQGAWRISYDEDEFCTLIEGHVRLVADNGHTIDIKAPHSFTIPAGFRGIWHAVTPVRKYFVIYEKQ